MIVIFGFFWHKKVSFIIGMLLMKQQSSVLKKVLVAGGATFAMFFGSGNLVFPIGVGFQAGSSYWVIATFALTLSAVLFPFLGLVSITLLNGSLTRFYRWIGKYLAFILPLFIILLLGPFGVAPRCLVVAHGAWQSISPTTPAWAFSLCALVLIWFANQGNTKIIDIIGRYFTPFKLGSLLIVIGWALYFALSQPVPEKAVVSESMNAFTAFKLGFLGGYNTMDLMGAIFFGVSIMEYCKDKNSSALSTLKRSISAHFLGVFLLFIIYVALVYLGVSFSGILSGVASERMLPVIVHHTMGTASDYVVSITLVIACLTTAVALVSVSTDYVCNKIPLLKKRKQLTLLVSLGIMLVLASTGFSGIASFLGPILSWVYPIFIGLVVINLFDFALTKLRTPKTIDVEGNFAQIPMKNDP